MFRESVRTWAPGWVTAFYFILWTGFCAQRCIFRGCKLSISVHQLPGRGRNAQLRDMIAWNDYSWYHRRGVCWATDTVGLHVAAAMIAPVDACGTAFRHARDACHARYDSWHWWLFWTIQNYKATIHRALWIAVLYLVSVLAHIWHSHRWQTQGPCGGFPLEAIAMPSDRLSAPSIHECTHFACAHVHPLALAHSKNQNPPKLLI